VNLTIISSKSYLSDRAAYRNDLDIGRMGVDEMKFVKAFHFIVAHAPVIVGTC